MSYPRGKHIFFVVSPNIEVQWSYDEPPEYGPCVAEVEATSQREAKKLAYKDPAMKDWIEEARFNKQNPFIGMKVTHPSCAHEPCVCWHDDMMCSICYQEFMNEYP